MMKRHYTKQLKKKKQLPIIKYLTSLPGIYLTIKNRENKTFLHLAAESSKNETIMNHFLSLNQIPVDAKDNDGRTVLLYACKGASLNLIKILVKRHDIDVTATDCKGMNILLIACESVEDIDIIRFIVMLYSITLFVL